MDFPLVTPSEQNPGLGRGCAVRVDALCLARLDALRLLKRNTQALSTHSRGLLVLSNAVTKRCLCTLGLDLVLALVAFAMGNKTDVLAVECGDEVIPVRDLDTAVAVRLVGLGEHVGLNLLKQHGDLLGDVVDVDSATCVVLVVYVTARGRNNTLLGILGTELDTKRNTLELPVVELPSGGVALTVVGLDADTSLDQAVVNALDLAVQLFLSLRSHLGVDANGDEDDLDLGDAGRNNHTTVVTVGQDHDTDGASSETPRVLPYVNVLGLAALLGVGVLYGNVEHLGEVLSKHVRCGGLDTTSGGGDETLDCCCVISSGKLLVDCLGTLDDRNRQQVLVDLGVPLKDLQDLFISLLLGQVGCVTLLPQELTRSNEWHRVCRR